MISLSRCLSRVMTRPMKWCGHVFFIYPSHFVNKAQFFKQLVTLFVIYTVYIYEAMPSVYFTQIDNLFAFRLLTNYPGPFIMLFIFIVWISIWRFLFIINAVYIWEKLKWLTIVGWFGVGNLSNICRNRHVFFIPFLFRIYWDDHSQKSEHRFFFNGSSYFFLSVHFNLEAKIYFQEASPVVIVAVRALLVIIPIKNHSFQQ